MQEERDLPTRRADRASPGKPLTSKSSIYGRFLARFDFTRANNGRPRQALYLFAGAALLHASACTRRISVRVSPSLPLRSHKLSEHLSRRGSRQKRSRKDARVDHQPPRHYRPRRHRSSLGKRNRLSPLSANYGNGLRPSVDPAGSRRKR